MFKIHRMLIEMQSNKAVILMCFIEVIVYFAGLETHLVLSMLLKSKHYHYLQKFVLNIFYNIHIHNGYFVIPLTFSNFDTSLRDIRVLALQRVATFLY